MQKRPDSTQVKGGVIIMTGKEVPKEIRVPPCAIRLLKWWTSKHSNFTGDILQRAEERLELRRHQLGLRTRSSGFILLMWLKISDQKQAWEGKGGFDLLFQIREHHWENVRLGFKAVNGRNGACSLLTGWLTGSFIISWHFYSSQDHLTEEWLPRPQWAGLTCISPDSPYRHVHRPSW